MEYLKEMPFYEVKYDLTETIFTDDNLVNHLEKVVNEKARLYNGRNKDFKLLFTRYYTEEHFYTEYRGSRPVCEYSDINNIEYNRHGNPIQYNDFWIILVDALVNRNPEIYAYDWLIFSEKTNEYESYETEKGTEALFEHLIYVDPVFQKLNQKISYYLVKELFKFLV